MGDDRWHARAREWRTDTLHGGRVICDDVTCPHCEDDLAALLATIAAEERAACAALCDAVVEEFKTGITWEPWTAGEAAKRIRARGAA